MFEFTQMKSDASKMIAVFGEDLKTIRTGRARPSLVENIGVEAYGGMMKMLEVASIGAPEASLIVIKPWDTSLVGAIEKAIQASDLGINPVVDGQQIRLVIPVLTTQRREELVKLVGQKQHMAEEMLRDVRTKYKKMIDGQKGKPGISEDDVKRDLENLQKVYDEYVKKIAEVGSEKEKELMEM